MNFIGVFIVIRICGSSADQFVAVHRVVVGRGKFHLQRSAASGLLHGGLPAPQHRREAHFRVLGEPRFDPGLPVGVLLAEEDQVAPLAVDRLESGPRTARRFVAHGEDHSAVEIVLHLFVAFDQRADAQRLFGQSARLHPGQRLSGHGRCEEVFETVIGRGERVAGIFFRVAPFVEELDLELLRGDVFGEHPQRAFKYIEKGLSKEQILEKTGLSLGVKDASLAIEEGEIFVIMGLSGSGKSTMVRLLNRLIEPTRGQVLIDGVDIAKISDAELREVRRKKIAMVFQSFALMPHMTVLDNTAFGMELAGVSAEERREKALDALRQVGLENYAHGYPDELSGGMRQRVGLARALAINPDILLMDEAFSALDPLIRTEMQDELVKLQAKHQRTVVFISHDLDEAMRIGDRIAIMQNGEVVQVGTPDEILNNPANDYVRTFFRGVDISQVFSAKDIARRSPVGLIRKTPGFGPRSALKLLQDEDREYGYVIERGNKFVGVVSIDSLKAALGQAQGIEGALIDEPLAVDAQTPLSELLSHVGQAPCAVPVVDEEQQYVGIISKRMLLQALDREGTNNG